MINNDTSIFCEKAEISTIHRKKQSKEESKIKKESITWPRMVSSAIEAHCKRYRSILSIRSSMEYGEMLDKISKCLGQLLGSLIRFEKVDFRCDWLSRKPGFEFPFNTPLPFQVLSISFPLARTLVLHLVLNVIVWFSSRDNTQRDFYIIRCTKRRIANNHQIRVYW